MSGFAYIGGALHCEQVPIDRIIEAVGTPVYIYSADMMAARYRSFAAALAGLDATICYAVKANSNQAVIRTFAEQGAGADVVSLGEMRRAEAAGIRPERIVFSGLGKTEHEIAAAIDSGIMQFNVESEPELAGIARIASQRGRVVAVALRVNPDVDARTHAKISTGKAENKFGIPLTRAVQLYHRAATMPGIELTGLAVHIGSQLTDLTPFTDAFGRLAALVGELRAAGLSVRRLDLGGGLGVAYQGEAPPDLNAYGAIVRDLIGPLDCHITLEPGRWLVADAGVLASRVIYCKQGDGRRFVVLDGAMNDLMRTALYDAYHLIQPVRQAAGDAPHETVDLVGPVCESTDTFATFRELPILAPGDSLVFRSVGAYGAVMASTYNTRPLVPEVLVHGGAFAVVRERLDIDTLLAFDRLAPWQSTIPARDVAGADR